jgi:hypothetical protein
MAEQIRSLDAETLPAAISLLNESSRGTSIECIFDPLSFLLLARYWNFSFNHSLLLYVDNEPAALAMHCGDPELHEAFNYHWGTLPKFRTLRIALTLAEACAQKLRKDGYISVYGDSLPERPVRRWRFVHFYPKYSLVGMQSTDPHLPSADPRIEIRAITPDIVARLPLLPDEPFHWCQRVKFLTSAAPFHVFLGAFRNNSLVGYAAALRKSEIPTLIDLRSIDSDTAVGYALLRSLREIDPRAPFRAYYVFEDSYLHRLLNQSGFANYRQFSILCRDLPTTT